MYTVGLDKKVFFILFSPFILYNATGARVATFRTKSDQGVNINHVKEILFGSILGDGQLELPPRGINARFGFTQAFEKKDYFIHVLNSLSLICSGHYREHAYLDKRTGKVYKSLNF